MLIKFLVAKWKNREHLDLKAFRSLQMSLYTSIRKTMRLKMKLEVNHHMKLRNVIPLVQKIITSDAGSPLLSAIPPYPTEHCKPTDSALHKHTLLSRCFSDF
jgi:hypothetical protein